MRPCMGHWAQYQPLREHWEQWGEPQIPLPSHEVLQGLGGSFGAEGAQGCLRALLLPSSPSTAYGVGRSRSCHHPFCAAFQGT